MMKQDELLKILVENKAISLDLAIEIRKQIQEGKGVLDDILFAKKIIDSESLVKLKSGLYNLPSANLLEKEIAGGTLNIITSEVSENYKIICFEKNDTKIKVGIIDPENFKAVEAVDYLAKGQGLEVEYYLISPESFHAAFKGYKSASEELTSALKKKADEDSDLVDMNEKEQAEVE